MSDARRTEPLACPRCALAHPISERFCRNCGMPLVYAGTREEEPITEAHERARKVRPQYARGDLVRVTGARNLADGEMIQAILLDQGIPSMLRRARGFDVPDFLAGRAPRRARARSRATRRRATCSPGADMLSAEAPPGSCPGSGRQRGSRSGLIAAVGVAAADRLSLLSRVRLSAAAWSGRSGTRAAWPRLEIEVRPLAARRSATASSADSDCR